MPVPISGGSGRSSGTACRIMFEPINARLASSCSRNGIKRRRDRPDLRRRDVHQVDLLGRGRDDLAVARPAQHLALELVRLRIDLGVGLGDHVLLFLGRVEPDDLVGDDAVLDLPVGRLDEAVLGDRRERRQRADQADVRPFRRLDRAHAPVVGRVHVADLDRSALAGQATGAERREAPTVRQAGQRVGLVHELRELRRAEELLLSRHDRADVDDRLRRDRVGVLGREPLAHDTLHPVEADPECLLDQLSDGAQTPVPEMLVLVEVVPDRLARHRLSLGRVVLDLLVLGDAEHLRQADQLLDQLDDVVVGQHAVVEIHLQPESRVELVAADARQVVALGVEEQRVQQRLGGFDRRRLAGALLLEQLDQRAVLGANRLRVGGERVLYIDGVVEQLQDLLVGADPDRAQQHRHRQLALAVDTHIDAALLVDLQLQPGAARRHQVGDEDLLLTVLGLHHVRARRTHQLRHDDALGAVDDERALVRHPGEVAHEDGLLADLARVAVLERDLHVERPRVDHVLLTALVDRCRRIVEPEIAEDHREVSGVVLDRRDVVDRLTQPALLGVGQPLKRAALYVDQIREFKGGFE